MAATVDFIKVDRNAAGATQAGLLLSYVNTLRAAYDIGKRVSGIMNHNNTGTIFTQIETLFGLPTGQGQIVFNLVNGSVGSMEGSFQVSDARDITERVGG